MSPLLGTWELVYEKWGDAKEFTSPPAERKSIKFITPIHLFESGLIKKRKSPIQWAVLINTKAILTSKLPSNAFEGMEAYVGKPQKFTAKVEGDKWTHSGTLSEGQTQVRPLLKSGSG